MQINYKRLIIKLHMKTKNNLVAVIVTFSLAMISCTGNKTANPASGTDSISVETRVSCSQSDSCCQAKTCCDTDSVCAKKADCNKETCAKSDECAQKKECCNKK